MSDSHYQDEIEGILKRLEDNWIAASSPPGELTPVLYWQRNRTFERPTNPPAPWISIKVDTDEGEQISLGPPPQLNRYEGIVTVQIFEPEDEGTIADSILCKKLDDIFDRAQFEYLQSGMMTFRVPGRRTIGVINAWYQTNWTCVYQRDKYK